MERERRDRTREYIIYKGEDGILTRDRFVSSHDILAPSIALREAGNTSELKIPTDA